MALLSEAVLEPAAFLATALAKATSQQGALHLLRVVDLQSVVENSRATHILIRV